HQHDLWLRSRLRWLTTLPKDRPRGSNEGTEIKTDEPVLARELGIIRRHARGDLDRALRIEAAPVPAHRQAPDAAIGQGEQTMMPAGAELSGCVLTRHSSVTICVLGRTQYARPFCPAAPALPDPLPLPPLPP